MSHITTNRVKCLACLAWRKLAFVLAGASLMAGVVLSLEPIGPCSVTIFGAACIYLLWVPLVVADQFKVMASWEGQHWTFLLGIGQALLILGIYQLVSWRAMAVRKELHAN
jgi:hypothetical protein